MVPMAENRVVVYKGPGEIAVENIEYPKLEIPEEVASAMGLTKEAPHSVNQSRTITRLREALLALFPALKRTLDLNGKVPLSSPLTIRLPRNLDEQAINVLLPS